MKTHARLIRGLGLTAIIGALAFPITDLIAILLRQGYNPFSDTISSLAMGSTGWIQSIGFYFCGVGTMAFAMGLYLELSPPWEVRLGEVLTFIAGVSLIFVAIFHANPHGETATIHGDIHLAAAFAAGSCVLPAFFLISPGVRHRKTLFIYSIIAGILEIVMVIGRGNMPSNWTLVGLHERLIAANAIAWLAIVSWAVLIRAREPHLRVSDIAEYEDEPFL